jgi:hypothetical protein
VDLKNSGFATEADAAEKAFLERKKTGAEVDAKNAATKKAELDNAQAKLSVFLNIISAAKDQTTYTHGRNALAQAGFDVSKVPEQFDPVQVQAAGQQALTALQRMQEERQRLADEERKRAAIQADATARRGQDVGAATARRGQDLTDARAREAAAKGQIIETADGFMVADPRAGTAAPLTAGGAPVKGKAGAAGTASESERTAGFLLQRIRDSQRQLSQAVKENPGAAKPGIAQEAIRAGAGEAAANIATGADRQRVESAQLDILDAALTLGTGAAYTREQLLGYRKSYFPQIGDDDAAIADKQERLQNLIRAAEVKAGRAATDTGGGPKRIKDNAEYDALPKGAEFIDPNGQKRRKP